MTLLTGSVMEITLTGTYDFEETSITSVDIRVSNMSEAVDVTMVTAVTVGMRRISKQKGVPAGSVTSDLTAVEEQNGVFVVIVEVVFIDCLVDVDRVILPMAVVRDEEM